MMFWTVFLIGVFIGTAIGGWVASGLYMLGKHRGMIMEHSDPL
jgi:hypothetical protein